jgi:acetyl esterase
VPLDPQVQGLLGLIELLGPPPLSAGTPEQARDILRRFTVDVRVLNSTVPVGRVDDRMIPTGRRRVRVRIYRPVGARSTRRATIVFFHGGGFVIGDLDTHDDMCRWLCSEVDAVVVSVAYRTAPEAPFPAAVEDALAATQWAADHLAQLGGDATRLVVAGDSAGGNLAAVVAQAWREERHRDRRRAPLGAQLLIYPVTDLEDEGGARYPSRIEHAEGYLLTGDELRWFAHHYLGASADRRDPRRSPIHGELTGLPPTVVVTAEYDPLRDEGEAYAAALEAAGVDVRARRFDGLVHGFFALAALSPVCAEAVQVTCALLREALASGN